MQPLGIQMYGLRGVCRSEPERLFGTLQAYGIGQFEPCVVVGESLPGINEFWSEADYGRNAPLLREHGLTVRSCHVFTRDIERDAALLAAFAQRHAIGQLVIGCCPQADRSALEAFAQRCMRVAARLRDVGAELLLHNAAADVRARVDGVSAYEWALDACQGQVFAQPDTGWLLAGGEAPLPFLRRKAAVIRSLHHKDFAAGSTDTPDVPIGQGAVDTLGAYRFGLAHDLPQILDQDCGDVLRDAQDAVRLFRSFAEQ